MTNIRYEGVVKSAFICLLDSVFHRFQRKGESEIFQPANGHGPCYIHNQFMAKGTADVFNLLGTSCYDFATHLRLHQCHINFQIHAVFSANYRVSF